MEEVIIEGLEEKDFNTLKIILETYNTSLTGPVSFKEIQDLYLKVQQIVNYLKSE
jgi:hypothetical protein